jgi:hypothetical protein
MSENNWRVEKNLAMKSSATCTLHQILLRFLDYVWWDGCGTVQIFGNDYNKSKPDSGGN